jgi:hypothetical protein
LSKKWSIQEIISLNRYLAKLLQGNPQSYPQVLWITPSINGLGQGFNVGQYFWSVTAGFLI